MSKGSRYGTFKVTFVRGTKRTQLNIVSSDADVFEDAKFYGPSYGRAVRADYVGTVK